MFLWYVPELKWHFRICYGTEFLQLSRFSEIYLIFSVIVAMNLSNAETEIGIKGNWKKKVIIYQNFLHSIFTCRHAAFERHTGIRAFLKPHSYAYEFNVWCIKNQTNHSSKTLMRWVRFLLHQTLGNYRRNYECYRNTYLFFKSPLSLSNFKLRNKEYDLFLRTFLRQNQRLTIKTLTLKTNGKVK